MKITRYNYGSLLPSEDEIIAQGRNFGEHEKSCDEVANILFPVIDDLTAKLEKMREALANSRKTLNDVIGNGLTCDKIRMIIDEALEEYK